MIKSGSLLLLALLITTPMIVSSQNIKAPQKTPTVDSNLINDKLKLSITVHEVYSSMLPSLSAKTYKFEIKSGKFRYILTDLKKPSYITFNTGLVKVDQENDYPYLAEPGDTIDLTITENSLTFSPTKSAKYDLQQELKKIEKQTDFQLEAINETFPFIVTTWRDTIYTRQIRKLTSEKQRISPTAFEVLSANMEFERNIMILNGMWRCLMLHDTTKLKFLPKLNENVSRSHAVKDIGTNAKLYSYNYADYLYVEKRNRCIYNNYVDRTFKIDFPSLYKCIIEDTVKDQITKQLALSFTETVNSDSVTEYLSKALYLADKKDPFFTQIENIHEKFSRGKPFFNFVLKDTCGTPHSIKEFRGKTMVIDFWFNGCGGCIQLAKAIKPIKEKLTNQDDVIFVSVNVDKNSATWKEGILSGKYGEKSDINLQTNGLGEDADIVRYYKFNSFPRLFIVDSNGRIYDGAPERPVGETTQLILLNKIKSSILTGKINN